jgi:hypothetical protein
MPIEVDGIRFLTGSMTGATIDSRKCIKRPPPAWGIIATNHEASIQMNMVRIRISKTTAMSR